MTPARRPAVLTGELTRCLPCRSTPKGHRTFAPRRRFVRSCTGESARLETIPSSPRRQASEEGAAAAYDVFRVPDAALRVRSAHEPEQFTLSFFQGTPYEGFPAGEEQIEREIYNSSPTDAVGDTFECVTAGATVREQEGDLAIEQHLPHAEPEGRFADFWKGAGPVLPVVARGVTRSVRRRGTRRDDRSVLDFVDPSIAFGRLGHDSRELRLVPRQRLVRTTRGRRFAITSPACETRASERRGASATTRASLACIVQVSTCPASRTVAGPLVRRSHASHAWKVRRSSQLRRSCHERTLPDAAGPDPNRRTCRRPRSRRSSPHNQ